MLPQCNEKLLTNMFMCRYIKGYSPNRKALVKLRISNHKLRIETGRYDKIYRCDRLCTVCGLNVEDEIHFLFHCSIYSAIKDEFFNKINSRSTNYKQLPISILIMQLMNSSDYYVCKNAVSTVCIVLY